MRDRAHLHLTRTVWLAAVLLAASGTAASAEFGQADCDRLKTESAALVQQGVPKLMEKGPDWAKANLDAAKLDQIKRLIDVSEQIMFRCEKLRPINTKVEQVEGEGADSDDTPAAGAAGGANTTGPAPVKPPPAEGAVPKKAAPKPRAKSAAAQPTGAEAPNPTASDVAPPKAAKAAKPKPKSNDAFVPAPGNASTLDSQTRP